MNSPTQGQHRPLTDIGPDEYDTDKIKNRFVDLYEDCFRHLTTQRIDLLELGVRRGGSLAMWRDYFASGNVVGLDREPGVIEDASGRITVYRGDQDDIALLDRIRAENAPEGFDIIVDDCAHIGHVARTSFWHLFEHHLKPGGFYAIEDFATGYLPDWPDGGRYVGPIGPQENGEIPSHVNGMVGFVKELIDACCWSRTLPIKWGGLPARLSKVERVLVAPNIAVVVKSPVAHTPVAT